MTKQMLRGIRVASKQDLEDRIYLYFEEVNADPVVFHWSYKLDNLPFVAGLLSNIPFVSSKPGEQKLFL